MKLTSQVALKASFQVVFWKVVHPCLSMLVDALPKIETSLLELLTGSKNDFQELHRKSSFVAGMSYEKLFDM